MLSVNITYWKVMVKLKEFEACSAVFQKKRMGSWKQISRMLVVVEADLWEGFMKFRFTVFHYAVSFLFVWHIPQYFSTNFTRKNGCF